MILLAVALCGCGLGDPCSEIKAKLASCQQPVPSEGECNPSLLDNYDMLMSVDCMAFSGTGGKSDWFWPAGGCDPGYHRCGGYFCCRGDGPVDRIKKVINSHPKTPYVEAPTCSEASWVTGMDCSCFVQQTFKKALGIDIPRNSLKQYEEAKWTFDPKKPGDLVFFFTYAKWNIWDEPINWATNAPTHVGIYLGLNEAGREVFAYMSVKYSKIVVADLQDHIAWLEGKDKPGEYKGARRVLDYWGGVGY